MTVIPIEMLFASSEQAICIAVPLASTEAVINAIQKEFRWELERKDIDRVWATGEVVTVTVVGEGMKSTPGVAGRVFGALGEKRINVLKLNLELDRLDGIKTH